MSKYLSQAELLDLIATSNYEASDQLRGALDMSCVELLSPTVVRAGDLLPTYKVRLSRWVKEGIPPSTGLKAFVAALERCGESEVALILYENFTMQFVILLSADLLEIFGIVAIPREDSLTD